MPYLVDQPHQSSGGCELDWCDEGTAKTVDTSYTSMMRPLFGRASGASTSIPCRVHEHEVKTASVLVELECHWPSDTRGVFSHHDSFVSSRTNKGPVPETTEYEMDWTGSVQPLCA